MPHRVHLKKTYVACAITLLGILGSAILAAMGYDLAAVAAGAVAFFGGMLMLKHHQRRYRKTKPYDKDET